MDVAICRENMRCGYARSGVYLNVWDTILTVTKTVACSEVTRRRLMLFNPRDTVTGWYNKEYETSTIDMILIPRSNIQLQAAAGYYTSEDVLGLTQDPLEVGDEIYTSSGVYYDVKTVRHVRFADSFSHRACDLRENPLHNLSYTDLTPGVEDAKYRTKVYWETYVDADNLNSHPFIVCYSNPDYPLTTVFVSKDVDIVFALDQPRSEPLTGSIQTPYGYREHVPTHVLTLDLQLTDLAAKELRNVVENNPLGSQRSLEASGSRDLQLGSHTLYDRVFTLNYKRGTT